MRKKYTKTIKRNKIKEKKIKEQENEKKNSRRNNKEKRNKGEGKWITKRRKNYVKQIGNEWTKPWIQNQLQKRVITNT